jgi:hypothetical protein
MNWTHLSIFALGILWGVIMGIYNLPKWLVIPVGAILIYLIAMS